jgi:hypothetical protein
MRVRRTTFARLRRAPLLARYALALLMFATFSLQAMVTQTHIHVGSFAVTAGYIVDRSAGVPGKSGPLDSESTNCLFCQEMLHSGQFITPSASAIVLPTEFVSIVPIAIELPLFIGAIPHGWQGRAPPQA